MTDTTTTADVSAPTQSKLSQTTAASSPKPASTPTPAPSTSASKSKPKPKRRNRNRRRAAASDNEASGDDAPAGPSDSSVSSQSDIESDHDDDDVAETPASTKTKSVAFPDVSSITPAGWTKKDGAQAEAISFEDFNAGKLAPEPSTSAKGPGLSIKGKAKGKPEPGQKREYTPEETAKFEANKQKKKEKLKAKKAELREKQAKNKELPKPAVDKPVSAEASTSEKPAVVPAPSSKTTTTQSTKGKGKKKSDPTPTVADLTASTSVLKLDDTSAPASSADPASTTDTNAGAAGAETSSRGVELLPNSMSSAPINIAAPPTRPQRGAPKEPAQRAPEDPKVTPRVGNFWTHDQRLNEGGNPGDSFSGDRQMNPFWRGRGMPRGAFRGGFQRGGRGRGGFFPNGRGGFVNGGPARAVELSADEHKEQGTSRLAMDREFELAEARDRARSAPRASGPETTGAIDAESTETPAQAPTAPAAERKWGHEGYETLAAPDNFRGGRGRGRGVRGGRGGVHPRGVAHLPFHPATIAAAAAKAASAASTSPAPASATVAPQQASQAEAKSTPAPSENMLTQPTADALLDPANDSVKVKFPGSEASVVPALATPPITPASVPAVPTISGNETAVSVPITVAPTAVEVSHEAQYPTLHSSSPGPVAAFQAQMYTGGSSNSPYPVASESGSAGSAPFVPQHAGHFYAPGMNSSGEFVPAAMQAQSRPFYPQQQYQHQHQQYHRSSHGQSPQYYQPQSPYSPGPSYGGPPMVSPQNGYYPGHANGYPNGHGHGRNSPLNPYMASNQGGGYFGPVRSSSKVSIRAPKANDSASGEAGSESQANGNGTEGGDANGHPGSSAGEYYAQHYNPYIQPFVPGHRQEAVYYAPPGMNSQQYGWQGYEPQGYYDGSASYGY